MMITADKNHIHICKREELLTERGYDLLIFRADTSGRIITGFPHSRYECAGKCVYGEELAGSDIGEYSAHMLSGYSRSAFLVPSESGVALIVRSTAPEAGICAALIIGTTPQNILDVAAQGVLDMVILPPAHLTNTNESAARPPVDTESIGRIYNGVREGFYSFCPEDSALGMSEIIDRAITATRSLAMMACCACTCIINESLREKRRPQDGKREFCGDIFTALTLLSLIACGRCAKGREAVMAFDTLGGELIIDIRSEIPAGTSIPPEIYECQRIADRKHLLYEYSIEKQTQKNTMRLRFCPVKYDWSVLGVKNQIVLED